MGDHSKAVDARKITLVIELLDEVACSDQEFMDAKEALKRQLLKVNISILDCEVINFGDFDAGGRRVITIYVPEVQLCLQFDNSAKCHREMFKLIEKHPLMTYCELVPCQGRQKIVVSTRDDETALNFLAAGSAVMWNKQHNHYQITTTGAVNSHDESCVRLAEYAKKYPFIPVFPYTPEDHYIIYTYTPGNNIMIL